MQSTLLYNKIQIREHPDLDPVASPGFNKGHSFIFPGDELVACVALDLPQDIGGTFLFKSLTSIKMSVIAKKPNIYSEVYGTEYAATREFELDSFTIPLNSTNAPIVPWGTDGYAPNINFSQDRSWALPSGDFRRQIKAFTTHTPSTSSWQYNFWYPLIFREDYWNALIAADNDFYDPAQPQNGKNNKWLRYHNLSMPPFGWKIFYKFELFYTQISPITGPTANRVYCELDLSNEQTEIQDYESNPDYALLEIKTCPVSGTPSNTPSCFVFGGQNTSCFGYFQKQSAWATNEKTNLSAVFRIRPKEGGDVLGSRASSLYPVDNSVVWVANTDYLATDSLNRITTDAGDRLVLSNSGAAVTISFDPLNDRNIIVQSEIDYIKLNAIFPGVTAFTLYCRLYNSTLIP